MGSTKMRTSVPTANLKCDCVLVVGLSRREHGTVGVPCNGPPYLLFCRVGCDDTVVPSGRKRNRKGEDRDKGPHVRKYDDSKNNVAGSSRPFESEDAEVEQTD